MCLPCWRRQAHAWRIRGVARFGALPRFVPCATPALVDGLGEISEQVVLLADEEGEHQSSGSLFSMQTQQRVRTHHIWLESQL